jgi:glycosyltransferase involved in cell wall biosynthesis
MTHEVKSVPHHQGDLADSPSTIGPPVDQPQCISSRFSRFDPSQPQSHNNANVLVTVLMPCLNEARTLAACIQQAHAGCQAALAQRAHAPGNMSVPGSTEEEVPDSNDASGATPGLTYEILIADNGSTDGSPEIAIANDARVVHVEQKGYGAALLGGIAAARGKYVVMGDSDCSYDFGEAPRFLDKLEEGYDLVMGNRFAGGILPGAMPWHHRYIGNPVLSGLGRLLYRTPCRDWHCGLRAFDREKIQALNLKAPGMEFASEFVLRVSRAKLVTTEIAITHHPDQRDRRPHLRSFRDGWRHLSLLIAETWIFANFHQITNSVTKAKLFSLQLKGIFLLCVLGLLVISTAGLYGGPKIVEIPKDKAGEFNGSINLRNLSFSNIEIVGLRTTCGCIEITSAEGPIAPFSTKSIDWRISDLRDFSSGQTISIYTNAHNAPVLTQNVVFSGSSY